MWPSLGRLGRGGRGETTASVGVPTSPYEVQPTGRGNSYFRGGSNYFAQAGLAPQPPGLDPRAQALSEPTSASVSVVEAKPRPPTWRELLGGLRPLGHPGVDLDAPAWEEPRPRKPIVQNGFEYATQADAEAARQVVDPASEWARIREREGPPPRDYGTTDGFVYWSAIEYPL